MILDEERRNYLCREKIDCSFLPCDDTCAFGHKTYIPQSMRSCNNDYNDLCNDVCIQVLSSSIE